MRWQTWLELVGTPRFNCLKMDIGGRRVCSAAGNGGFLQTWKPALYLSLHPHLLPESEEYAAMAKVERLLKIYEHRYDSSGYPCGFYSLQEAQALQHSATYLLLPE